jgi:hypothetical protein
MAMLLYASIVKKNKNTQHYFPTIPWSSSTPLPLTLLTPVLNIVELSSGDFSSIDCFACPKIHRAY